MKISIESNILANFPETKVGVLVCHNVNNSTEIKESIDFLRQKEAKTRATYNLEDIATLPKITDWRETYRSFGFKPSEYRNSLEALLRRVLQKKEIPSINNIVNIYNAISLSYLLPAGGGDLSNIVGDIKLCFANGEEQFIQLGSKEQVHAKPGEIIYMDNIKVLCRAWNYRESDESKITTTSRDIYLVVEGLTHTTLPEIKLALNDMQSLISTNCGGIFRQYLLHKDSPSIKI